MKHPNQTLKIQAAAPAKRLNQYLKASQAKPMTKQSLTINTRG